MVGEDKTEGKVARGGACFKRVMYREELGEAVPPVAGRIGEAVDGYASTVRHPLHASNSSEPQRISCVAWDQ